MGEPGVVSATHAAGAGFCFDASRIHDVRNGERGRVGVAARVLAAARADAVLRDRGGRLHRTAERPGVGRNAPAGRRLSSQPLRVPQTMTPPPRLSRRARMPSIPAAAHQPSTSSSGMVAPEPLHVRPEESPGANPGGSARRTEERQADARPHAPGVEAQRLGTPKSSDAIIPPGPDRACQRLHCLRRIVDVAEEIRVGQRVDRARRERQAARPGLRRARSVTQGPRPRRRGGHRRRASQGSGRSRRPGTGTGGRARSPRPPCRWRRRRPGHRAREARPARSVSTMRSCQRRSWPNDKTCAQRSHRRRSRRRARGRAPFGQRRPSPAVRSHTCPRRRLPLPCSAAASSTPRSRCFRADDEAVLPRARGLRDDARLCGPAVSRRPAPAAPRASRRACSSYPPPDLAGSRREGSPRRWAHSTGLTP